MRLIIAEKPSVGQAIAGVIGGARRADGYIECVGKNTQVTWCFGHLLEQMRPEDYVEGGRVLAGHLPVVPERWKLKARDGGAGKQLRAIKALLAQASEVVNAGDADREGQLLVDEVLLHFGWKGKTERLWLSSLDDESVRRALGGLKPNESYRKLYDSALGRQRADWLLGLNASIAISRNLQAAGVPGYWSVGRVQTPTLALLVDRKREIENFKARDHYQVAAVLGDGIGAQWQIPEDLTTEDGLLLDRRPADAVAQKVPGQDAVVEKFARKSGERAAPLPFNLSALQKTASRRLGLSAKATLAAAQELYEAKVSTYPRSDCPYLPEEMHGEAPRILKALGAMSIAGIDAARRHTAWNTSKVEAHHGIIPTGNSLSGGISSDAQRVFELIRESYIRLFMPAERFETREAIFHFPEGEKFRATARMVLDPGWTSLGGAESEKEEDEDGVPVNLPVLTEGQALRCANARVLAKRTKPPKPYTDGTLIAAMTGIHKLVSDPKLKARLKETSGLGTEATRASMIEVLIDREYAERRKKEIHPTDRGCALIDMLRKVVPDFTDPGATALQEDALAEVAAGRSPVAGFLESAVQESKRVVKLLLNGELTDHKASFNACPACSGQRCAALTSPRSGRPYHKCQDCGAAFADDGGKPGQRFEDRAPGQRSAGRSARTGGASKGRAANSSGSGGANGPACPSCKKPTFRNETRNNKPYFRCGGCGTAWWPDRQHKTKLGTQWEKRA